MLVLKMVDGVLLLIVVVVAAVVTFKLTLLGLAKI